MNRLSTIALAGLLIGAFSADAVAQSRPKSNTGSSGSSVSTSSGTYRAPPPSVHRTPAVVTRINQGNAVPLSVQSSSATVRPFRGVEGQARGTSYYSAPRNVPAPRVQRNNNPQRSIAVGVGYGANHARYYTRQTYQRASTVVRNTYRAATATRSAPAARSWVGPTRSNSSTSNSNDNRRR